MSNQFKVGDWVNIVRDDAIIFDTIQYTINYKPKPGFSLELWEPQRWDWVWHKLLGNLCQYKGPVEDSDLHSFYVPNFNHPQYSVTCASTLECEPYLGKLPSYIN